jgi:hypothetical protein
MPNLAQRRRARHLGWRILLAVLSLPPLALAAFYCFVGFIAIGQGIENVDRKWAQLCLLAFIGFFAWATTLTHALVRAHVRRALVLAAAVYVALVALRFWSWTA